MKNFGRWISSTWIASMIFFPSGTYDLIPEDLGLSYEAVALPISHATTLQNWFLPAPEDKGTLLFLHGNAGNISDRLFKAKGWVERGYSVFLLDYRGYGKSTGKLHSENDILQDAREGWNWLTREKKISPDKIILYGESIGSFPAMALASEHQARAIILEAPFTSFKDLAPRHYPWVPGLILDIILRDFEFSNISRVQTLQTPLFIVHGTADEICGYEMGLKLYEKALVTKEFFSVKDGGHNDLPFRAGQDFWSEPQKFIEAQTR